MKAGQFFYVIDCGEGPFSTQEAAEFHAAQRINEFSKGEVGKTFSGRARKAIIAKVEKVLDPVPGWKKFFMGGAA